MRRLSPRSRQAGFSLAELLVAAAIGLLMLSGMVALFTSSNKAQTETERANRQIENGRYALEVITADLRNAGFLGEFDPTVLANPAAVPDMCATDLAGAKAGLALHVQGVDEGGTMPGCLSDHRDGTDVLLVRRARSCVVGVGNCEGTAAGGPFFQASLCNNSSELSSGSTDDFYRLDLTTAGLDRHQRNCDTTAGTGTLATIRRYQTQLYFIANNGDESNAIPTLKRAEMGVEGTSLSYTIVSLAEGVENLQFEYGLDTNSDGVPDAFSTDPGTYGGCATADCANTNWRSVVAVRIYVLARNTEPTPDYTDTRTYALGQKADGSANTVGPYRDHYRRHVFQALVSLRNPVGRRTP